MLREILQSLVYRFHHGTRGDGGSCHIVKSPAILFDLHVTVLVIFQRGIVEAGDPVVLRDFDVIAQARSFLVRYHAYAADSTITVYCDDKVDLAAITIRRDDLQHCDRRLIVEAAAIGDGRLIVTQQFIRRELRGVLDDVVIISRSRHDLGDQFQFLVFLAARDGFMRQVVGQGQQRSADHRKEHQVERGVHGCLRHAASHGLPSLFFLPNTFGWVYSTISGTQMFISNVANAVPSGNPQKARIREVIRPAPAAKIKRPLLVVGLLTGSVSMKNAPSIAGIFHLLDPHHDVTPLFHWFAGAAMLGAFFILTDPVSSPTTNKGRLIFAAGAGLITYLIRAFGGFPDGTAFATLLMNICVPLIVLYTQPKVFGKKNKEGRP